MQKDPSHSFTHSYLHTNCHVLINDIFPDYENNATKWKFQETVNLFDSSSLQLSLTSLKSLYESLRFIASNGIPAHTNRQGNMHTQQQKMPITLTFLRRSRRGEVGVGKGGSAFKNIQHRSKASPVLCVLSSRCPTQPQEEAEGGSAPRAEGSTGR